MERIYWQQLLREDDVAIEGRGACKSWRPASDGPLMVRLESRTLFDHQEFDGLIGKVVRITVEVVEDRYRRGAPDAVGEVPADYAIRVRAIRKRLALTQTRLAEQIGVSFASVNRWENDQAKPTRLAWQQILDLEQTNAF